jgi:hypothetical protein
LPEEQIKLPIQDNVLAQDVRASLRVFGWVNAILDAAARRIGKDATHEAVMVLLILDRNGKLNSRELIQAYRSWSVALTSTTIGDTVRLAEGQLLRAGLITVGSVGETKASKLKDLDVQTLIGTVLEAGVQGIDQIRLTGKGQRIARRMHQTIDERFDEVRDTLGKRDKKLFKKLFEKSLPVPPRELPIDVPPPVPSLSPKRSQKLTMRRSPSVVA